MKEAKLEFLGQCHSPNSVRGMETHDRKQVWVGDTNYNYSLDSDCEAIAEHVAEFHSQNTKKAVSDTVKNDIRRQLCLEPLVKKKTTRK